MRVRHQLTAAACGLLVGSIACGPHEEAPPHEHAATVTNAVAVLSPTAGSETRGTVTFTRVESGISVVADIVGLQPGTHGFHIHEFGDCSAADGTSAGGHFNPEGTEHGAPTDSHRHVGDLGNVTADDLGTAHREFIDAHLALDGANSIIGRGVIVHAGEDDLTTQPTGAAGARVACGVVGVARH